MHRGLINQNSKHIDFVFIDLPAPDVSDDLVDSKIDISEALVGVDRDRVDTSYM